MKANKDFTNVKFANLFINFNLKLVNHSSFQGLVLVQKASATVGEFLTKWQPKEEEEEEASTFGRSDGALAVSFSLASF